MKMEKACNLDVPAGATPSKAEPCEDTISREATVKELCKFGHFMNEKELGLGSPYIKAARFIQDDKDKFPPVTPKQKVGEWTVHPKGGYAHLVCSNCLSDAPFSCKTNYCPNCGAYMGESEEV